MENVNPAKRQRCETHFMQWARPTPTWTPGDKPLLFMQVDIDYYTDAPQPRFWPGLGSETRVPVLRMYGVTQEGNSVLAHIHGFLPYFYVPCPEGFQDCKIFGESLELHLAQAGIRDKVSQYVENVELVQRSSLMHFKQSEHSAFFKVTVAVPSLVSASRTIMERGFDLKENRGNFPACTSFETNIQFALRFMVDRGLVGGGWVKLDDTMPTSGLGGLFVRPNMSTCQL